MWTYRCHRLTKFFLRAAEPRCPGQISFFEVRTQKSWLEGTSADHQCDSLLQEGLQPMLARSGHPQLGSALSWKSPRKDSTIPLWLRCWKSCRSLVKSSFPTGQPDLLKLQLVRVAPWFYNLPPPRVQFHSRCNSSSSSYRVLWDWPLPFFFFFCQLKALNPSS